MLLVRCAWDSAIGIAGAAARNAKSRRRLRAAGFGVTGGVPPGTQYRRWRLVTSRELRRIWRFTAAAALRLRSWVGFS